MPAGTVKWFNIDKGFGFIQPDGGGADVFAHCSHVTGPTKELTVGQKVSFEIVTGSRGPQAENIVGS